MKKSSLLFILLAISISFSLNAQVFTTSYMNDSVEIKENNNITYNNNSYSNYKIMNYDNDGYWSKVSDHEIINYNDTLGEICSVEISTPRDYQIKYGNKLYLLNYACHDEMDTNFLFTTVVDSISFFYYDISSRTESYVNINDSLVEFLYRYIFLEQSKEIAIVSAPRIDIMDSNSIINANHFKVTIIDTLGNILRYNNINKELHAFSFDVQANNILISGMRSGTNENISNIYYIDKLSLELVDSINTDRNYMYFRTINDSIICGINASQYINIAMYNTRSKTVINNYYQINSPRASSPWSWLDCSRIFIDFKNSDSIFFSCELRDGSPYGPIYNSYGIEIFNFKLDGSLNYRYLFNNYKPEYVRGIRGVTATNDYGLILDVNSRNNDITSNAWLLKYSPYGNGYESLNDIEINNQSLVNVYPNPAKDFINVDIEATNFKKSEIELFDMQGKLVKKAKLNSKKENRIDVSNLNSGAYTYNVMLNGKTISGKVIIGK